MPQRIKVAFESKIFLIIQIKIESGQMGARHCKSRSSTSDCSGHRRIKIRRKSLITADVISIAPITERERGKKRNRLMMLVKVGINGVYGCTQLLDKQTYSLPCLGKGSV